MGARMSAETIAAWQPLEMFSVKRWPPAQHANQAAMLRDHQKQNLSR